MAPSNIPHRRESRARRIVRRLRDRSEISPFYKYVLFFTNFVFLLAGIAVTAVGTYVLVLKEKKVTYFVEFLFDPSCLMCLAGSIMVFAAFFGCGGALRENMAFIRAYYWILSILLLFELIIVIFVFIFYFVEDVAQQLKLYPENLLRDAIIRYREDVDMRNFIDDLQEFLSCCGVSNNEEGFRDWNDNKYFNCTGVKNPIGEQCSVPYSCCIKVAGSNINYQCGYNALTATSTTELAGRINTKGCLFAIKGIIESNVWIIGGIIFAVLLPQAILVCMSKTLYDQVMMQKSKW